MVEEVVPYGLLIFSALEMSPICWTVLIVELASLLTTVVMLMMLELTVQVTENWFTSVMIYHRGREPERAAHQLTNLSSHKPGFVTQK